MATAERIPRLAAAVGDGAGQVDGLRAVVHDRELDAVSWVFPFDRKLPGLPELMAERASVLANVGVAISRTEVAGYAPEKSVTLRCSDGDGRVTAYAKLYADAEESSDSVARSWRLAGPAASVGVATPRVVASVPARHLVVFEAMPGRRLDLLSTPDSVAGMRGLGRALARLHGLPADAERALERFTPEALRDTAALLARVRPDVADHAEALAERLAGDGPFLGSALLHGDVHLKNGLLSGDEVQLVDLDQCASGHPAADIGSLFAAVLHRRMLGLLSASGPEELETAFLAGYTECAELDGDAVRWHTAAAILVERAQRAVHRVLPASLVRLPSLLAAADRVLSGKGPS